MRYFFITAFLFLALAPIACLPASVALATGVDDTSPTVTLINPLSGVDCSSGNGNCLSAFLTNILQFVVYIGSIVVILMLVYVGYMFVVARGNPGKIEEARKALLYTIIGALILLGAQAIATGIQATVQALSTGN